MIFIYLKLKKIIIFFIVFFIIIILTFYKYYLNANLFIKKNWIFLYFKKNLKFFFKTIGVIFRYFKN